ncbi:MAG: RusA family crossover junction endodeoxyribonuclease [Rhodobacteraceae bacterium]|nr:RusA family crossover junction endodeoxyribonuclease [Paracoccaceae bacterium]
MAAKNGRKLRGQARTERYNTWRNAAGWQLNKHHLHLIPGPFSITIAYGLKNRKRGSDLDNRIKAVLDILQEHQAIENDRLCEGIIAHWDEEVEGCWVNILPTKATSEKWEMAG